VSLYKRTHAHARCVSFVYSAWPDLNKGAYNKTDAMHYEYDWYGRRFWLDSLGHRHYGPSSSDR
jgi:hypothetical protein